MGRTKISLVKQFLTSPKGRKKGLSNVEAITMFKDYRLSGTIHALRTRWPYGHRITTVVKKDATGKAYSRYFFVSDKRVADVAAKI